MLELLANFRAQDAVDIAIISVLIYRVIDLIRGTRAARMLIGLLFLVLLYLASQSFQLYTVNWLLDGILSSLFLIIVVIFQNDIRRALTQVGSGPFFGRRPTLLEAEGIEEIVRAVSNMAARRIGALVVLERRVGLADFVERAVTIDARISRELIISIFTPPSPLHDGAVVIREGRIAAAGCVLPLTTNPDVSHTLGTRHRAAMGLTEETDALVVVVSEEQGVISLVQNGRITRGVDAATLRQTLQKLLL